MRTDWYTKAILTVIAICLVWMSVSGVTPTVQAQAAPASPTPVMLVDARGVPLMTPEGLRVNVGGQTLPVMIRNESVPVLVGNDLVPVVLRSVERRGAWQAIQVDVLKQPPTPMPTP